MKSRVLLLVIALPTCVWSQAPNGAWLTRIDRVCGTVVRTEIARTDWSYHSATKPLGRAVAVSLYHRLEKKKCCAAEQFVIQTQTDVGGRFEFPNQAPGEYWVVVSMGKKTHELAVTLAPSVGQSESSCSHFVYDIRNGDLRLRRMYRMG